MTTTTRAARLADARTWAGYRSAHFARSTGALIVVVHAGEAGLEDDPAIPWATVCEEHSTLVCHPTRLLATYHASDPAGWCSSCRET